MQNLRMVRSQKRLETLPPALFVFGCVALFSRSYGATLTSPWLRLKALLPLVIAGSLAIVLCDHFWVAESVACVLCSIFIWLTFDKKQDNFPDRLASRVAQGILRCGLLVLSVFLSPLKVFVSRVPPVPTAPPRFFLA